jgi:predicted Zn finger-like uncharacterized protein
LIITCEQCATQFQLDDARIPEKGARVRCSRCKHRFFVKPGAPAGDDPLERVVERTLAQEPAADTDADTLDSGLAPPAPAEPELFAGEGASGAEDDLLRGGGAAEQGDLLADRSGDSDGPVFAAPEIDAEEDPLGGGADLASPDPFGDLDPDDLSGGGDDGAGDLIAPSASEPAEDPLAESSGDWKFDQDEPSPDVPAARSEAPEVDAAREAVDDLLGPAVPSVRVDGEPLADTDPGVDDDLDTLLGGAEPAEQERRAAESPAPAAAELGSPDSWDFLSEGEPEPSHVAAPPPALSRSAAPQPFAYALPPLDARAAEIPAAQRWLAGAASAVGWAATAALSLLVLLATLGPGVLGRAQPPARALLSAAGLEAYDLRARWVENALQGDLLVISGRLRAAGDSPAPAGTRLAVRLLGADGGVLVERASPLAAPLPEAVLREQDARALRERLEASADAFARLSIPARDGVPFEAVVSAAPEQAARFDLVAIPRGAEAGAAPQGTPAGEPPAVQGRSASAS